MLSPDVKPAEPLAQVQSIKPVPSSPPAAARTSDRGAVAGRVIPHPAPVARRARDLDRELLDWWRAAPDGLDEGTWEELLGVLQRRGPSIHDVYRAHRAGMR